MKYYKKLTELGCFSREDVRKLTGSEDAAHSILYDYLNKGLIQRVRRNLYVALDLESGLPVVEDRFVIAAHISDNSYITHHSAFEYYGCYNQVYNWVFTSGDHYYKPFEYDYIEYHYHSPHISVGVDCHENGVRVTDLERTVLDGIADHERIDGLEELVKCIELLPPLDEKRLLAYLKLYNNQYLYQKVGYILEHFKAQLHLSDNFFRICQQHISGSKRYLSRSEYKNTCIYHPKWMLYAPKSLQQITAKETDIFP